MTLRSIRFRCPCCGARIKAPVQLVGRSRDCPRCRRPFLVPSSKVGDAGPVLVLIEGYEGCHIGVAHRRGAVSRAERIVFPQWRW